jgi:molybdenum cofactor biosynthesis enzyme MoaA
LRKLAAGQSAQHPKAAEPVSLQALTSRIEELSALHASVMMRGFEPFQHPDLVGIVQTLSSSRVRRVGVRTDAAALANLRDAQGCIDNGVRIFEIPLLPRALDTLSQAPPMEASMRGIQGIRSAAAALGVDVFVSADIGVCTHTAAYFMETVQAAIAAGVDAIRITGEESVPVVQLVGATSTLDLAHSLATRNSVAFFGDGCENYLKGAALYEVVRQQGGR